MNIELIIQSYTEVDILGQHDYIPEQIIQDIPLFSLTEITNQSNVIRKINDIISIKY